jgi:protein SCO1
MATACLRYTWRMNFAGPHLLRNLLLLGIALLAFGLGVYVAQTGSPKANLPEIQGFLWPDPPTVGPFTLENARGGALSENDLRGKWTLLFFGFTHCPDVCPTTLSTLKTVRSTLQTSPGFASHSQVLFVSVDPARDTPAALQAYVSYFDPTFLAATADPAQLNILTRQLGILYAKVPTADPALYTFDHTASVLLVGPDLQLLGVFSPPHVAADIASRIRGIVEFIGSSR